MSDKTIRKHGDVDALPEKPKIHMTGGLHSVLEGRLNNFFSDAEKMGFEVLDWRQQEHRSKSWSDQTEAIADHITESDLFILLVTDASYAYTLQCDANGKGYCCGCTCYRI